MVIVGVDPGQTGAICALTPGEGIDVWDMPVVDKQINVHDLARLVLDCGDITVAAVEAVHSMPGQGVASTFKFGRGYGAVLGVLAALNVPTIHVPPTRWCKAHNLTSDKEGHRRRAVELFPLSAHLFARKKDDGRADAALIALWASWQHQVSWAS